VEKKPCLEDSSRRGNDHGKSRGRKRAPGKMVEKVPLRKGAREKRKKMEWGKKAPST